jgi:hypothetical protein
MSKTRNVILLSLIDIRTNAEDDPTGDSLKRLWTRVLMEVGCLDLSSNNNNYYSSTNAQDALRDDVFQFIKRQDQYMALVSVLFKSKAYYETRTCSTKDGDGDFCCIIPPLPTRPIARLARTQYRKPYLPPLCSMNSRTKSSCPISVSHQYPFVGIARLTLEHGIDIDLMLGLDIVVFEDWNRRLYDSVDEFINVFQDSFTKNEWSRLQSCSKASILQEFYLNWAVKESYTKALGVGLGFDFASFQMDFDCNSLWATLASSAAITPQLRGTLLSRDNNEQERWLFFFQKLENNVHQGYACTCVGPLSSEEDLALTIDSTSLQALIDWHCGEEL